MQSLKREVHTRSDPWSDHEYSRSKDALNSLHTLLNANIVESCKKLIYDLSLLWAIQADKADFSKLAKGDLGTSLIPDIDRKPAGHPVVLKSTANGDFLYNSISLFFLW